MFPDDTESQEQTHENPFLEKHQKCTCPKPLEQLSTRHNLSCQKLFTLAYLSFGYSESFARAMLAQFIKTGRKRELVPAIVSTFCDKVIQVGLDVNTSKPPCFGCKMTKSGFLGVFHSYGIIHPEVDESLLKAHALSIVSPQTYEKNPLPEDISEEDRAWIQLVQSGILEEEDWGSIVKQSDSDF